MNLNFSIWLNEGISVIDQFALKGFKNGIYINW